MKLKFHLPLPCLLPILPLFFSLSAGAKTSASGDTTVSQLKEIVVSGTSARLRLEQKTLGAERLELSKLADMPALFGESDLLKSITLLPGVQSGGEGSGGFGVRGGTSSQNLIELDGMTLYNPSHVMGIFSTFNDDALASATLFKGPIPARFGGGTSSALQTTLNAGETDRWHATATVGILAAKAAVSGPIVKDKLSFAVAARRSYLDMFVHLVPEYRSTVMNFYDLSAKLRFIPSSSHRLEAIFFYSHDNMAIKKIMGMYWGNLGGSINWLAHCGDWSFLTTAAVTDYSPDMRMSIGGTTQAMTSYIHDYSINEKISFSPAEGHMVEFGLRSQLFGVMSAEMTINDTHLRDLRYGWQNALWADYDAEICTAFAMEGGIRLSLFSTMNGKRFHDFYSPSETPPDFSRKDYFNAEPRISLKWNISSLHNIKAGFSITTQNLHAIRSTGSTFPFDRYAITSSHVKPEKVFQYGLGYTGMTAGGDFDWSAEIYWKSMENVYDFKDGRNMFDGVNLESLISCGRGRSYGAELMFRKNNGPVTGWISYTISRTQTKIADINGGKWYDAANDRRHDFSVTAIWTISPAWKLSGSWIASSGLPLTAPDVKYEIDGITYYYYSKRNGYRTPPVHRLDISASWTKHYRHFDGELSFGLYNAYWHYNPYVIYFESDPSKPSGSRAVQLSLFGIVPSVSYSIKF